MMRTRSSQVPRPWKYRFAHALAAAALLLTAAPAAPAWAGTVKGTVKLPDNVRSTRLYQGYWRLENGNVPVQTSGGAKAETVVVLDDVKGSRPPPARTVTIEIGGLDARPRLVIVGPGSVVEIKNTGKFTHEFSTPKNPNLMGVERLPPNAVRRQKFDTPGGYVIRDAEHPHIMISVIVASSPYYSPLDERGAFSVPNVPDGRATLKVWTRGDWASTQEIDTSKKDDLTIKIESPAPGQGAAQGQGQGQSKEAAE
jgi:plastocyanin